jgi:ubiquinone/menaquinone biosynthesis C-methylase UbiE
MKMTRIEKQFVNREKKSELNIQKLEYVDLEKIKTVLEIGCGIGFVSHYLTEKYNFTVYGTDYDNEQIQIANKMQPKMDHLSFKAEDAAKLSFADSNFDLVLSQNVFHHIPNWGNALKEVTRILRPYGYFVWLDLTFPGIVKNIFLPFVRNYGLYTIDDIEKAFEVHKFKKLFHERSFHGPFSQHHFVLQRN